MALNEVFPGTINGKRSLGPMVGTVNSGDPVKVGRLVGVAQTTVNATGDSDPVNSNAPGYATVWCDGAYKLTVVITGTAKIGDPVYCAVTGSNSAVALSNTSASGRFLFGYLLEPSAAGTVKLTVEIAPDAGVALP